MYELEWLIGVGIGALVLGLLIGLALGRTLFRSKKTKVIEQELETAETALREYRAQVYDQFAETARKFEKLNDSYHELHRHLATSANSLLGDGMTTPLLQGPAEPAATGLAPAVAAEAAGEELAAAQSEAEAPESSAAPESSESAESKTQVVQDTAAAEADALQDSVVAEAADNPGGALPDAESSTDVPASKNDAVQGPTPK